MLIVPSGSLEADALKVMVWPGIAGLGLAENDAVGGALTRTVRVVSAGSPAESVTRIRTVFSPDVG